MVIILGVVETQIGSLHCCRVNRPTCHGGFFVPEAPCKRLLGLKSWPELLGPFILLTDD